MRGISKGIRLAAAAFVAFSLSTLVGCGVDNGLTSKLPPSSSAVGAIAGKLMGGQQPVAGSHVYLFAVGTSGYGTASTSLLQTGTSDDIGSYVLSDANGNFSLTGQYTCTAGTQVYAYALGGDSGAGDNSMIGMMAVLGNCPSSGSLASQVPLVVINEVSTVAAAYALAGYATDATHMASSGSTAAVLGVANAAANAAQLDSITSISGALATTPVGNGTVPQALVNTLADILAACINSSGASSAACTTIQSSALNGSTQPTDTATAAINIAHLPGANVKALYDLTVPNSPFQPSLTAQPSDFSITLTYPSEYLLNGRSIAVDLEGNIWVAGSYQQALVKNSPLGAPLSYLGGAAFNAFAFMPGGDLTVSDTRFDNVSVYDPSTSTYISQVSYAAENPVFQSYMAVDRFGFFATTAQTTTPTDGTQWSLLYNYSGNTVWATSPVPSPLAVAVDGSDYFWVTSYDSNNTAPALLAKFKHASTGAGITYTTCQGTNYVQGYGVAIDSGQNAWVSDHYTNSLVEFSNNCSYVQNLPTISAPLGLAIDGNNTMFTVNANGRLGATTTSGTAISPADGYNLGVTGTLIGPAIDGSGNAWLLNYNTGKLEEVLGIAAPVVTPLSVAAQNIKIGQRP
ncbi:MAG: hypothetical protein PW792_17350 [Acidobacteriaceae bacterium]|nr:hypothetical protein [Acidobacteriaceae bacterium]